MNRPAIISTILFVLALGILQLYSCKGGDSAANKPDPIIMSLSATNITACSVELNWYSVGSGPQYQVGVDD